MLLAPCSSINRCNRVRQDDSEPASTESQHLESKGGSGNGMKKNDLRARQARSDTGLYMEYQTRKFCQVHALNALLGTEAVKLEAILQFCKEHAKDDTALGNSLRLNIGWSPNDGNFSDMVINAFLHYHSLPTTWLFPLAHDIPKGSSADMFLRGLPADQSAFVLRWHYGNLPYEDPRYGHAVCVKCHPISKKWFLLDSEVGRPVQLDDAGWQSLKGSVYVFAKGSAYNYNSILGAEAEGYEQWRETLDLITPDEVVITARANTAPRPTTQPDRRPGCITLEA